MAHDAALHLTVGPHRLRRERDSLFLYLASDPTLDEVIAIHGEVERVLHRYGWAFLLIDGSRGFRLSPEARRWISAWHARQDNRPGGSVTFNATLVTRTFLSIVVSAINTLLRRRHPLGFAADEDGARAWVARQRAEQGLELPPPDGPPADGEAPPAPGPAPRARPTEQDPA